VPTGLTATGASVSQINLSWNASTAATGTTIGGYKVYVGGSLLVTTTGTGTTYSHTGLAPNTSYSYTVAAYNNVGGTSAQSTPAVTGTTLADTTLPSSPGAVSFSSVTPVSMTVSWGAATDNVGVTGYEYQVNSGTWVNAGNVLTVSLSGLTPSTN